MRRKWSHFVLFVMVLVTGFALGHYRHGAASKSTRRILFYKDPMHPSYRSEKPGTAPDCGMDLVPVYADEAAASVLSDKEAKAGETRIDAAAEQLYGIKLAKAERDQGKGGIQVFARVVPDETLIYHVNFGTDGYVKETHGDAVGNFVTKNQHLAIVYSPDFLAAAGGYLAAHERNPTTPNAATGNTVSNASQESASAQARADRLRNLGMSDTQIDEITKTRRLPEDIYVVAPSDGFILSRKISPGMRFERESDLYTIANLRHVWIVAEVFGRDAQAFRPGAEATATLTESGQSFRVKVSNVLPEVDPTTRTVKVRLEADNPQYRLRPDMFVSVSVPISLPPGISVPTEAILDTGLTKRVFVQKADGAFESRTVETGWQSGDRVQVVKGLREGETVVSSGTFLVDSESRLKASVDSAGSMSQSSRMAGSSQHSAE